MINTPIGEMLAAQNSDADKTLSKGKESETDVAGFMQILETLADHDDTETSDPETKDAITGDAFLSGDGVFAVSPKPQPVADTSVSRLQVNQAIAVGQSVPDGPAEKTSIIQAENNMSGDTGKMAISFLGSEPDKTPIGPTPDDGGIGASASRSSGLTDQSGKNPEKPTEHQQEIGVRVESPKTNPPQSEWGNLNLQNDMSASRLPVGNNVVANTQDKRPTNRSGAIGTGGINGLPVKATAQKNMNRQSGQIPGELDEKPGTDSLNTFLPGPSRRQAGIRPRDAGSSPDKMEGAKSNSLAAKPVSDTSRPERNLIAETSPDKALGQRPVLRNFPVPESGLNSTEFAEPPRNNTISAAPVNPVPVVVEQNTIIPDAQAKAPLQAFPSPQAHPETGHDNLQQRAAPETIGQNPDIMNRQNRQYPDSVPALPPKQTNPEIPPTKPLVAMRPVDGSGRFPKETPRVHLEPMLQTSDRPDETGSIGIKVQPDQAEKEPKGIEAGRELPEFKPEHAGQQESAEIAETFRTEYRAIDRLQPRPEGTLHRPEIARHIARQLVETLPDKPDRPIELSLNPAELGRLRMTLTLSDGNINFAVQAERVETADLMRRHIETLAQEFRDMGFANISFDFSGNSQGSWGNRNESPLGISGSGEWAEDVNSSKQEKILVDQADGLDLRL